MIRLMALRNVGVDCLFVYATVLLFLPRSLNILFRNLDFMNLILKTKYTLSTEFVLAQVRVNKRWRRTSQVRLKILNYRTLSEPSSHTSKVVIIQLIQLRGCPEKMMSKMSKIIWYQTE